MNKEERKFGIMNYFKVDIKEDDKVEAYFTHCPKCESHIQMASFERFEKTKKCIWNDCDFSINSNYIVGSIMLIGSMRFSKIFFELERQLTFMGYNVILPFVDGMFNKKKYKNEWEYLLIHMLKKIDLVQGVFVVNNIDEDEDYNEKEMKIKGYIGNHTKEEILYIILTKSNLQEKDWWKYINSIYPINFREILLQKEYVEEKLKKWNNLGMNFHTEEIMNVINIINEELKE